MLDAEENMFGRDPKKKLIKAMGQVVDRQLEEALFEEVVRELDAGIKKEGLWAKALMFTEGDAQRAYPKYIELRAQAMRDDALMASVNDVVSSIGGCSL